MIRKDSNPGIPDLGLSTGTWQVLTAFSSGGDLQYSNGEVGSGLCGEPQSEVGVGFGEVFQRLLQLLQPVDEQVAVL